MSPAATTANDVRADIRATWRGEPVLRFAGDREHVDPKTGIARYGPASLGSDRHPATIRIGYVGTGASIASAQRFFADTRRGVPGESKKAPVDFPGFTGELGFFSEVAEPAELKATITAHEVRELKNIKSKRSAFRPQWSSSANTSGCW